MPLFCGRFIREVGSFSSGTMRNLVKELMTLKRLQVSDRPSKASHMIEIIWHPPSPDWIKVNTNDVAFGALGLVGFP